MCFHSSPHQSGDLAAILQFSTRKKGRGGKFHLGRRMLGPREGVEQAGGWVGGVPFPTPAECRKKGVKAGRSRLSHFQVPKGRC